MDPNDFSPLNTCSQLLAKIGSGTADADFARAMAAAVARSTRMQKKSKVVLTVEIEPRDDVGALVLRASVEARLPKLPAAATQMHVGPNGELLTQLEHMFGGGPTEAGRAPTAPVPASSGSARLSIAPAPTPGPVTSAPLPVPLTSAEECAAWCAANPSPVFVPREHSFQPVDQTATATA